MGGIAFVFSGQGDQYPGMGQALAQTYDAAAEVFACCDRLRPGTSAQCFAGPEDVLKETKNTQPCLFAMEMAAAAVLRADGVRPDAVAGFSLGELAACVQAGIFDLETGFRLVCRRGELMQKAAEGQATAMAAAVRLSAAQVRSLCGEFSDLYPVNYNAPGQTVVAGAASQMPAFSEAVRRSGGRLIPLQVSGAFHSPFMRSAAEAFSGVLASTEVRTPQVPIYSDLTGRLYGRDIRGQLARQICSPVLWEEIVRQMLAGGIDTFIEIGPGKTLTRLIGRIDSGAKCLAVCEMPQLQKELEIC